MCTARVSVCVCVHMQILITALMTELLHLETVHRTGGAKVVVGQHRNGLVNPLSPPVMSYGLSPKT